MHKIINIPVFKNPYYIQTNSKQKSRRDALSQKNQKRKSIFWSRETKFLILFTFNFFNVFSEQLASMNLERWMNSIACWGYVSLVSFIEITMFRVTSITCNVWIPIERETVIHIWQTLHRNNRTVFVKEFTTITMMPIKLHSLIKSNKIRH